jgi:hypothetical protein
MELSSFMETASPPASSTGCTIRLPLERRFKLFLSAALFLDKCIVAIVADGLVLIVSAMILILLDLCYALPKASLLSVPPIY